MKASQLKVGDRVRIVDYAGNGKPDFWLHPETRRVYKKLMARRRPVRVSYIDDWGPWYICRFKRRNGTFELHHLNVEDFDNNWVKVKSAPRGESWNGKSNGRRRGGKPVNGKRTPHQIKGGGSL